MIFIFESRQTLQNLEQMQKQKERNSMLVVLSHYLYLRHIPCTLALDSKRCVRSPITLVMYAYFLLAILPLRWNVATSFSGAITSAQYRPIVSRIVPTTTPRRRRQLPTRVSYDTTNDTSGFGPMTESTQIDAESDHRPVISHVEDAIVSPVLRLVYPDLLKYVEQYGHPNIPLGSEAGRQCATLRRLHVQTKLVESDVAILDRMNFIWHSLEDVYTKQKEYFDDFMQRLQKYKKENDGDISPPKKYKNDPELGAWVTAVRRLYTVNEVDDEHVAVLNEFGFQWNSPRKCGSKFMQQYRSIQDKMESITGQSLDEVDSQRRAILNEPEMKAWIQAQQTANLSETRKHYMAQLVGDDWMHFGQ